MLLVIHNLPYSITLGGIKQLIKDKCNISEVILDNFLNEGCGKRVTVGLADESDAVQLVGKMNGLLVDGHQLHVEDIRQKKLSEKPYSINVSHPNVPVMQMPRYREPMIRNFMAGAPAPPVAPMTYNMPFYMSPVPPPPARPIQRNSVSNNAQSPFGNVPGQAPFIQQNSRYEYQQFDNQNQWKAQAVTYPTSGSSQKSEMGEAEMKQYFTVQSDNDWRRGRRDSPSKNIPRMHEQNSSLDTGRQNPRWGDRDIEHGSSKENSTRERSPRDRSRRERSPRERSHRERSPRERGSRREEDLHRKQYSSSDRSQPRDRFDQRDRSRPQEEGRSRVVDYRRTNRDVDQRNKRNGNNQNREVGNKRQYSTTYSSNPNNSTFRQNNIFAQKPAFRSGFVADKYDSGPRGPPKKVMRTSGNEPAGSGFNKGSSTLSNHLLQTRLLKHSKWITHASGILSKEIVKNAGIGFVSNYPDILTDLRKCVVSRIDVILHDRVAHSLQDVLSSYRAKFNTDDDPCFFKAVLKKHERDMKEANLQSTDAETDGQVEDENQAEDSVNTNVEQNQDCVVKPEQEESPKDHDYQDSGMKNPRPEFKKPTDLALGLLKNAGSDDLTFRERKKLVKIERIEELYTDKIEPRMRKVLDEEVDSVCKQYTLTCEEIVYDPPFKNLVQEIKSSAMEEFRKTLRSNLSKRLLDIPNNLLVRVFAHPKPPKREVLNDFLKNYHISHLKKCDKNHHTYFVLTCADYKTFDELIKMSNVKLGETLLQFRAMHFTTPKTPASKKKSKNILAETRPSDEAEECFTEFKAEMDYTGDDDNEIAADDSNENIDDDDDTDEAYDSTFILDDDDTKHANDESRHDDSDVILLEDELDIVLVDDNDKNNESLEQTSNNDTNASNNDTNASNNDAIASENNDGNVSNNEIAANYDAVVVTNKVLEDASEFDEGIMDSVNVAEDDLEDF